MCRELLQKRNLPKSPLRPVKTNGMWEDSSGKSEFDDLAKGVRTFESEVGQNFSIDLDLFLVESGKKSRVGGSIQSGCSIDTCDPELPEHSLPSSAIAIGILHPFVHVVLCNG
jgi:hypothetical protein